jgi:hypothetical protein
MEQGELPFGCTGETHFNLPPPPTLAPQACRFGLLEIHPASN